LAPVREVLVEITHLALALGATVQAVCEFRTAERATAAKLFAIADAPSGR